MKGNRTFAKGESICYEGEVSNTLFIINEGKVKLSKMTKEGKEQIVHILATGDFFGELNLFHEGQACNFTAYAITPVKMCTISKKDMDQILLEHPQIAIKILSEVTKRLSQTENLVQNLANNDAEVRIAYMIVEFGEQYGVACREGIRVDLPLTREEMANYVGVTRETISRKLSKFENLNLIKLIGNKQLIVKNMNALREYE